MPTPSDFKAARAARKAEREAKAARRRRWVPFLQVVCKKYGIKVIEIPGGYQFRSHEYIVSWWLSSNKISIQYPGSGEAVKFEGEPKQNEPKIFAVIRKLIKVTKGEEISEMSEPRSTSES
jgi:hypothetical protein